jgi:acyl-CoA synthetase (AMP-forming)/AMP-acid ligase II
MVEQVLKAHPAVLDALVAGVPDERFGERVAAEVELRPGAERAPVCRASCTRIVPMPPLAPSTRTVCPARTSKRHESRQGLAPDRSS